MFSGDVVGGDGSGVVDGSGVGDGSVVVVW